jgi:tRNA(Ile)-lysidine synthase TilS/MesJ
MAMLHILKSKISLEYPINLHVVTFNHKLRAESDEEVGDG